MRRAGRFLKGCLAVAMIGSFLLATGGPVAAAPNPWSSAGSMAQARGEHAATLLADGRVLVVGGSDGSLSGTFASAELYDPATNTWSSAGTMAEPRESPTATLLGNGKVLVVGGRLGDSTVLASAELYDPATNTWSSAGSMAQARDHHTATLLGNGMVLVAGGCCGKGGRPLATAELYDPATNTWLRAGGMSVGVEDHTATLLLDGRVLVAGGLGMGSTAAAQLYEPSRNKWTLAASMPTDRNGHTATLLQDGKVLVAGGGSFCCGSTLASTELYDPVTNTWAPGGNLATARVDHAATILTNGKVLVAGGLNYPNHLTSAEVYDPGTNAWSPAGNMAQGRELFTLTLLGNGEALAVGGMNDCCPFVPLSSAELYNPFTPTEDSDPAVQFDGWVGFTDPAADGGAYRASKLPKDTVKFVFSGTAVTWLSRSGPDRGMAGITIDGVSAGTFDLYAPSAGPYSQTFSGLTNGAHAIVVKVLGTKNASSTNTWVPVDGFTVGSTTTQESSPAVKLGTWTGQVDANASGGTYRISSATGASSTLAFTATSIDWVTATGPNYGQAQVSIDGVSKGTVDLYSASAQWQVLESYTGLSPGPHTIVVKVLGTKNPSSNGTGVVVDAFVVHA